MDLSVDNILRTMDIFISDFIIFLWIFREIRGKGYMYRFYIFYDGVWFSLNMWES